MFDAKLNDLLTQVGPGTPAGTLMRRYWQPVATSAELTAGGQPKQVRILGEDLVLFRDDQDRAALLGLHCSHRLTSLGYGRVEDGGIRCPFHGWLYDFSGRCLEQPAEPEGSRFKDHIRHTAYPCQEMGGLVFAYMGPADAMPLLPRYETLAREDGTRKVDYYQINSSWLQNLEGAVDTVHGAYLHTDNWSRMKHRLASQPKPDISFEETDYGICERVYKSTPSDQGPVMGFNFSHFFMPGGYLRMQETNRNQGDWKKYQSWYVPVDDTHTLRFQSSFAPLDSEGKPYLWEEGDAYIQPGPENDYFRDYERYDTISGIPCRTEGSGVKGFMAQDNMVNETQGPIVDRSRERLGAHDPVLTAMRLMLLKAIHDVQEGMDPKHIIRDPEQNAMVYIRGSDALERV